MSEDRLMEIAAWIASIFVFFSFFMKTMVPLRIVAIGSNIVFIIYSLLGFQYGLFGKLYPILILHSTLLPLNLYRLYQIKTLVKKIHESSGSDISPLLYLVPFMSKSRMKKGTVLFHKGDMADKIYYIQKGTVVLPEIGKEMKQGELLGEVGIFTPDNRRALSAECSVDCEIFSITGDKVLQMYYQDPRLGFFLIRSIANIVTVRENFTSAAAAVPEKKKKRPGNKKRK